jgi:hypothetical protein
MKSITETHVHLRKRVVLGYTAIVCAHGLALISAVDQRWRQPPASATKLSSVTLNVCAVVGNNKKCSLC